MSGKTVITIIKKSNSGTSSLDNYAFKDEHPFDAEEWKNQSTLNNCLWHTKTGIQILCMVICASSYLLAFVFHVMTAIIIAKSLTGSDPSSPETEGKNYFWQKIFLLISIGACIVIETTSLLILFVRLLDQNRRAKSRSRPMRSWIPMYIWLITPYIFSCSVRQFIDNDLDQTFEGLFDFQLSQIIQESLNFSTMIGWFYVMSLLIFFGFIYILIGFCINATYVRVFFRANFNKERAGGRKTIRILDTMASILTLIGMIIGLASLFVDQYDIEFDPDGFVKDIIETTKEFEDKFKPLTTQLNKVIETLDRDFTCEDVFHALGTGAAVGLFASFFPGASSVVSVGSRSAYYGVRAASALTNLAKRLRKATSKLWRVSLTVLKFQYFVAKNMKKLVLATNSMDIGRILPLLPPVVLGIYVLFGVFWPSRVVFFTAKQRRGHMSSRFQSWTLALVVLVVAVLINTVFLDEVVKLLDDNIAIAKVTLNHNLGWELAMSASAFALAGTFLNWIVALVLMISTNENHENLTNQEKEWQMELEKRELVTIKTPLGNIYQKRTHLKYKRARISPWNWVLPVILTLIACGFGIAANLYPKLEMIREPRGPFGRMVDKVYKQVSLFENDEYDVKNDTSNECLPYPTLDDVLTENPHLSNVLINPVNKFYNLTRTVIRPLKDSLNGFRRQMILDIDEEIFGGNMDNFWQAYDLQYLGMLFTVPRVICLLILLFGCFMASIFKCTMQIACQALEPRKIVDAYGKVALFSLFYVVGAQLSLFNLLSSFGVPFYHIYVRFSAGFVYDVVADGILLATYIGMNNEFFFAIPRRKTTVTYTVPGVSDPGPNIPGQII